MIELKCNYIEFFIITWRVISWKRSSLRRWCFFLSITRVLKLCNLISPRCFQLLCESRRTRKSRNSIPQNLIVEGFQMGIYLEENWEFHSLLCLRLRLQLEWFIRGNFSCFMMRIGSIRIKNPSAWRTESNA